MINDMEQFRTLTKQKDVPLEIVAHQWMAQVYQPTIQAIPREMFAKLEPAQIFHEILDHRWFIAEHADHDILMSEATASYIENVLKNRPDEKAMFTREEIEDADFTEDEFLPTDSDDDLDDWSGYLA